MIWFTFRACFSFTVSGRWLAWVVNAQSFERNLHRKSVCRYVFFLGKGHGLNQEWIKPLCPTTHMAIYYFSYYQCNCFLYWVTIQNAFAARSHEVNCLSKSGHPVVVTFYYQMILENKSLHYHSQLEGSWFEPCLWPPAFPFLQEFRLLPKHTDVRLTGDFVVGHGFEVNKVL